MSVLVGYGAEYRSGWDKLKIRNLARYNKGHPKPTMPFAFIVCGCRTDVANVRFQRPRFRFHLR